jgi:uncharacterized membrane protein
MKRPKIEHYLENKTTLSDRISDYVTDFVGSWRFIVFQTCVFFLWIGGNIYFLSRPFDSYPFIFLNLVLAFETVYTTPLVMMSQNRQESRDRVRDDADYEADISAEKNVEMMRKELAEIRALVEKYIKQNPK